MKVELQTVNSVDSDAMRERRACVAREESRDTLYSATNNVRPVNLYCGTPSARSVHLIGDFNGGDPSAHPMHRRVDGGWFLQVSLTHGDHRYLFIVDGEPMLDPRATGVGRNERDEQVSVIAVS